jgi:plasmid replication initiation protein
MKNRNIVKQDFALVNAKYKLNTNEIKFIMTALAQINMDDKDFDTYEIKVSDFEDKLGSEQNETRLKQFAKGLMSKPFEVELPNGWAVFNWFSKIQYVKGQAKFIVRIDNDLKPLLLDLKERFVKYNLRYILPLTSSYSIRIYQLLKEYEKATKRTFTVEELQNILQVPKSLKTYANFKNKVLKTAEKELLAHCDIYFEFEEIKEGRKVNEILFRIKPNKWLNEEDLNILEGTNLDEDLKPYIGKKLYLQGYNWHIISISKNDKNYSIFCQEIDDKNYTKTFEISEAQLRAAN